MSGEHSRYQDRSQERAQKAWTWVDDAGQLDEKNQKRYGTLARKLPGYLQVSGLGQTMAFLYARHTSEDSRSSSGAAERLLLEQLSGRVREVLERDLGRSFPPRQGSMEMLVNLKPAAYRLATREAMAAAEWLKRFAEGRLGQEEP